MASAWKSKVTIGANTLHCNVVMTSSKVRDTENTNSSHSATNYDAVIPDNMAMLDIPWDPTNTPMSLGFIPGQHVTCIVFDGDTGKTVTITSALVGEEVRVRDVANDIIRSKIPLKGGSHTHS